MINLILAIEPFKSAVTGINNVNNIETATVEIIAMLLGAFLFGFFLRHLIGFFRKKEIIIDNCISPEEDAMRADYIGSSVPSDTDFNAQINALRAQIDKIANLKLCNCSSNSSIAIVNTTKGVEKVVPILDENKTEVKAELLSNINQSIIQKSEKVKADPKAKKEVVKEVTSKKQTKVKLDDLKIIERIGPALEKLLNTNNIFTFEQLAAEKASNLERILDEAGPRFRVHVPETWPEQALLLKDGKMEEFQKLTEKLKGGRKI